jgi:2-alkyl-3-oxoalkanoate reductase
MAKRALMTGISGQLGGALAHELAARGWEVAGVVRGNRDVRSPDGSLLDTVELYGGTLDRPLFGLDRAALGRIDALIHCAAATTFDAPLEALRAVNVDGTQAAIAAARALDCPLVHVSTAYVSGTRDGEVREEPVPPGTVFANAYEQSKAEAEALVLAAAEAGQAAVIARPSIVLGRSTDGRIGRYDMFFDLYKLLAKGMMSHVPVLNGAALNLVPIDHVTSGLADLAEHAGSLSGKIAHLTAERPYPVRSMIETLHRYPHFAHAEVVDAATFDPAILGKLQRRVHDRVGALYFGYFTRTPLFEAKTIPAGPSVDDDLFHRMIAVSMEAGFLEPVPA